MFIREGFQFDYIFYWTNLKYQQSQLSNTPSRVFAAGMSSGIPPMATNSNRISGGEEGSRPPGWSSSNPSQPRNTGMPFYSRTLSKQKNSASNDPSMNRELSSSNVSQLSGSSRRPAVSSSRGEADLSYGRS
ncbi:hypothetical protein L2E82_21369 [Cichorium intybus]|uniref:Uncharacterized protein n=1 Tax=Cichorium intybus TaxID=13427 RepID=A0ACB9DW55_CICIN|nr:hypothetical protein L2E82_21369 [Cichorium intybus]